MPPFEEVGVIYARPVATPAPAGPNTRHHGHRMQPEGAVREQPSTRFTQSLRGTFLEVVDDVVGYRVGLDDRPALGVLEDNVAVDVGSTKVGLGPPDVFGDTLPLLGELTRHRHHPTETRVS